MRWPPGEVGRWSVMHIVGRISGRLTGNPGEGILSGTEPHRMSQLVIDLSGDELASVEARASEEGYASPSTYVKDVLKRGLAEDESDDDLDPMAELILDGENSGPPV